MTIKLLIKSCSALQKYNYDIKIVPISINYDRIFDVNQITASLNDSISIESVIKPGARTMNVYQKVFMSRKHKLGKCIVKHCDPISLDDYLNRLTK